jgi:hypothetical protein
VIQITRRKSFLKRVDLIGLSFRFGILFTYVSDERIGCAATNNTNRKPRQPFSLLQLHLLYASSQLHPPCVSLRPLTRSIDRTNDNEYSQTKTWMITNTTTQSKNLICFAFCVGVVGVAFRFGLLTAC